MGARVQCAEHGRMRKSEREPARILVSAMPRGARSGVRSTGGSYSKCSQIDCTQCARRWFVKAAAGTLLRGGCYALRWGAPTLTNLVVSHQLHGNPFLSCTKKGFPNAWPPKCSGIPFLWWSRKWISKQTPGQTAPGRLHENPARGFCRQLNDNSILQTTD